jgi:hypothetical protein
MMRGTGRLARARGAGFTDPMRVRSACFKTPRLCQTPKSYWCGVESLRKG